MTATHPLTCSICKGEIKPGQEYLPGLIRGPGGKRRETHVHACFPPKRR